MCLDHRAAGNFPKIKYFVFTPYLVSPVWVPLCTVLTTTTTAAVLCGLARTLIINKEPLDITMLIVNVHTYK